MGMQMGILITSVKLINIINWTKKISALKNCVRDRPFDIQGGGGRGWDFFEKNNFVSQHERKNKMSSMKLKIKSLFFIQ